MATTRPSLFGGILSSGEKIIRSAAPLTGDKIKKIAGRGLSDPERITHADQCCDTFENSISLRPAHRS